LQVFNIKENNRTVFVATERFQSSSLNTSKTINYNITVFQYCKNLPLVPISVLFKSSDILPNLPDCWEIEISKKLSIVVVQDTTTGSKSLSVITPIKHLLAI
jgi:hypothetical protein